MDSGLVAVALHRVTFVLSHGGCNVTGTAVDIDITPAINDNLVPGTSGYATKIRMSRPGTILFAPE